MSSAHCGSHRYRPLSGTPSLIAFVLSDESRFTAIWTTALPSVVVPALRNSSPRLNQALASCAFAAIARSEWQQYSNHVSDWERHRYLTSS